ncbi:MAG: PilZ domain-containing protein [Myxococcota bacterium]
MRQPPEEAAQPLRRDRLSPRRAAALPVDYRSAGLSGRGILTDIAPGGLHVTRTTAPVSLDQQLRLRLWLCRGQLTLELPAVVVRVEEGGFAAALPYAGPDIDEALSFAIRRLIPREPPALPPTRPACDTADEDRRSGS